jgi:amino acid transporter
MSAELTPPPVPRSDDPAVRRANVRTALILATIAVVFFLGIVFAKYMGDAPTSMTVLGVAVLLFLLVAIGRNLRRGK